MARFEAREGEASGFNSTAVRAWSQRKAEQQRSAAEDSYLRQIKMRALSLYQHRLWVWGGRWHGRGSCSCTYGCAADTPGICGASLHAADAALPSHRGSMGPLHAPPHSWDAT